VRQQGGRISFESAFGAFLKQVGRSVEQSREVLSIDEPSLWWTIAALPTTDATQSLSPGTDPVAAPQSQLRRRMQLKLPPARACIAAGLAAGGSVIFVSGLVAEPVGAVLGSLLGPLLGPLLRADACQVMARREQRNYGSPYV